MSDARFRPFGYSNEQYQQLLVSRDGVPDELKEPLLGWIFTALTLPFEFAAGRYMDEDLAHRLRALTRIDLGQPARVTVYGDNVQQRLRSLSELDLLRIADALAYVQYPYKGHPPGIDYAFELASSKWEFQYDEEASTWRLGERLPEGVLDQISQTIDHAGTAGQLLHRAFTAAYQLSPNAGEAYKMSVKAVETAAHKTIEPNNAGATLGTMLGVMRRAPRPWTIPLDERADHAGNNATFLVDMMSAIWDGQEDRHRDGQVALDEARSAFHAATTIVAWFAEGLVQQR